MTHSEPSIPGAAAAAVLLVTAFVLLISVITAGVYGMYSAVNWAQRLF